MDNQKKPFYKRPVIISVFAAIIIIAGFIVYSSVKNANKSPYEFTIVQRGEVIQEVSVTGRVKPAANVDLAFERSGKAQTINIKVGDKVAAGQVLMTLNNSDLAAQVAQAQASLAREQANLDQLQAGARPEDLQIAQTAVANAQKSLSDAQASLANAQNAATVSLANLYDKIRNILSDAYVKADDAINNQIAGILINYNSTNPQLTFYTDSQLTATVPWKRQLAGASLSQIKNYLDYLPSDQASLDAVLLNSKNQMTVILDFMNATSDALTSAQGIDQTTINAYKYNVNLGRTNVNNALTSIDTEIQAIAAQKATNQTNINTAQTALNNALSTLRSAQDNLILKQAGSTNEQIVAQAAQVKYAQANLQSAQALLDKTVLRAPIAGVITRQNTAVGEIIAASVSEVSINSAARFEMEANIPEADIAKVKVNDSASVTLDAYGNSVIFDATVTAIDPAETIVDNVATYKTKLQFTKDDDRIKSGLTANIDIMAAKSANALFVPQRAVITRDNEYFVRLGNINGTQIQEQKIVVGLKGSDGNYEIISGLKEGDRVVSFIQSQ